MTRDEMFEKLDRILEDMDAIALLLASSGNTPIRPIHTRISKRLHAVLDALRAEAHSAPMPVIAVGDVVLWDKGIEPVWEPVWKPSMAATWAKMGADEKAYIAAIERDGVTIWRREVPRG